MYYRWEFPDGGSRGSRRHISGASPPHLFKQPLRKGTQMKLFGTTILLSIAILLTACGSSNNNNNTNVNGNWTATLTDQSGNPVFAFTTSLTTNSDGSVTGTNLTFNTNNGCFANGATQTGAFSLTGNFSGSVTGGFSLNIQSPATGATGNNTLSLQGTLNNNAISGTWTLAGLQSGCTGSGTFTMTRM